MYLYYNWKSSVERQNYTMIKKNKIPTANFGDWKFAKSVKLIAKYCVQPTVGYLLHG